MDFDSSFSITQPANENADPLTSAASALEWLYQLRDEMRRLNPESMTIAQIRQRQALLRQFPEVEKRLLAAL